MDVPEHDWTPAERKLIARLQVMLSALLPLGWLSKLNVADAEEPHRSASATTIVVDLFSPEDAATPRKTVARVIWFDDAERDDELQGLARELAEEVA